MECRVIFDYKGTEDDELDLKKGELVSEVTTGGGLEEGWWSGKLNGKRGVFPNNFVEPIVNAFPNVPAPSNGSGDTISPTGHSAPKYAPVTGQSEPLLRSGVNRVQRAKVTFSYKPVNADELRLDVGDVVEIFTQVEDGWFSGANMGSKGVFPSNFVEMIEDPLPPTADPSQPQTAAKDGKSKPPVGGVALPFLPMPATGRPAESDPSKPKRSNQSAAERAKVTYSYEPQEEDELRLEVGEVIEILNKEHAEGWWEGRHNGKTGVFPNNFVEILAPEYSTKGVPHKPIAKPIQAPRVETDPEAGLPRKPSLKGAPGPILAPKRSGPTNELQRKLDRRNLLNTGPDSSVAPTDNGVPLPPQPPLPQPQPQPARVPSEEVPVVEEQKQPLVRRSSHEHPRPAVVKASDNSAELEQLRIEVTEAKKETLRLKQEYREDFDRLLEEREADRKLLSELKIEVDSLKKRRADYWNPDKFF